jgi:uncharacterized membrane protein YjjP (DUF1212 family)
MMNSEVKQEEGDTRMHNITKNTSKYADLSFFLSSFVFSSSFDC